MARSIIICVDDDKLVLSALSEQLVEWFGKSYTIEKALSGEEALMLIDEAKAEGNDVSVVVSDYIMPNMKGDELLEKIQQKDPGIKKIMLTGYAALDGIIHAINKAGLYRFLAKPWDKKDLMLTLLEAIKSYESEKNAAKLATSFKSLYQEYESQYVDNLRKLESVLSAVVNMSDARVTSTAGHSVRVRDMAVKLAETLNVTKEDMRIVSMAALLHDIDKLGMSDADLTKMSAANDSGGPSQEKSSSAVSAVTAGLPDGDKVMKAIQYMYENFNGTGPNKLSGQNIPLASRIINVANYYDCAVNILKQSKEDAVKFLNQNKGSVFDPQIVEKY